MRKSIVAVVVLSAVSANALAASAVLRDEQDPTKGYHLVGTNNRVYDLDQIEGNATQQHGQIYNLQGDTQRMQTQIDDNKKQTDAGIQDNANKIGLLSRQVGQNAQGITTLTNQVGQNSLLIGANTATNQKQDKDIAAAQQTANRAGALASTANGAANAALQGVTNNGAAIQQLQGQAKTFATKPELAKETNDRMNGDADLDARKADKTALQAVDQKVDTNTNTLIQHGRDIRSVTAAQQGTAQVVAVHGKEIASNQDRIAKNEQRSYQNSQTLSNHTAVLQNHETRITNLEKRTNGRLDKVESDVKEVRKAVNRVGALSTASANLHYNRNENGYAVAVGEYAGSSAIAGGMQFSTSETTAITVQVAYDGADTGASVGFHGNW